MRRTDRADALQTRLRTPKPKLTGLAQSHGSFHQWNTHSPKPPTMPMVKNTAAKM